MPKNANFYVHLFGKSSESVQRAMLKACDACADMGQLQRTVPIRKTIHFILDHFS